jgi:hypothetical protein
MTSEKVLYIAKKRLGIIVLSGLLLGALSFVFLITSQKNFRANSDLLISQSQPGFSDYYAMSKSADYLSGILIESIYSEKFIDEVGNTNIVRQNFLPSDKRERLIAWSKIVKASKDSNLGIIHLEIFANTQKDALDISNAILSVLNDKKDLFLGNSQNIEVKVLSGPIWEKNPSVAEIAATLSGGFLVGAILCLMQVYRKEEKKYRNVFLTEEAAYQNSLEQF